MAAVGDLIEKAAVELLADGASDQLVARASIAISLKRIADALDGTALGVDISESLAGLTHAKIYGRDR